MSSPVERVFSTVVAAAVVATTLTLFAAPAGARVGTQNTQFCQALASDQGAGTDFEGLGPVEATYAAGLTRKLAKTGVPAKLKRDLEKLAKLYDKIAAGAAANAVVAGKQKFATMVLVELTSYVKENCTTSVPSTT